MTRDLDMRRTRHFWTLAAALTLFSVHLCVAGELRPVDAMPAPPLELEDLSGATHNLSAWRGKVVLLNFWTTWCQPCLKEMPGIQRLAQQMTGKPFAVVGVNVGESRFRAQRIAQQLGLDFPILLDTESKVFLAWGGKTFPTTALLDAQGALRYVGLGPLEWDDPEEMAAVEQLLNEVSPTEASEPAVGPSADSGGKP